MMDSCLAFEIEREKGFALGCCLRDATVVWIGSLWKQI